MITTDFCNNFGRVHNKEICKGSPREGGNYIKTKTLKGQLLLIEKLKIELKKKFFRCEEGNLAEVIIIPFINGHHLGVVVVSFFKN